MRAVRSLENILVRFSKNYSRLPSSSCGISTFNSVRSPRIIITAYCGVKLDVRLFGKMSSGSSNEETSPGEGSTGGGGKPKEWVNLQSIPTWTNYFAEHELTPPGSSPRSEDDADNFKVDTEINDKVSIWRGDITKLEIDAIVNAANSRLIRGGGVDGCIHEAAGDELQDECDTLDGCPEGTSKMTKGYKLPAKHVIHTVGPRGERPTVLSSAYNSALTLMLKNEFRSIAFPCISTGIYGYPQDEAAHVACLTVRDFLEEHKDKVDRIIFATFLKDDLEIYEELMQKYFPIN